MLRLNFIKVGLILALSVLLEVGFYFVLMFFGNSDQPNWINLAYGVFHYPAIFSIFGWVDPDAGIWQAVVWVLFCITVAVFQWWLIILAGIWSIRHFRRKSA